MLSENLMTGKSGDADEFGLYTLVEQIGLSPYGPDAADLDKNGMVDWPDLALLADNWLWEAGQFDILGQNEAAHKASRQW
jgi:hypothetical protein